MKPRDWFPVLALLLAVLSGVPAAAQSVRLGQPNASRFPEVTLYAYPADARGVLMGGLDRDAFRVTENGRPATITRVESQDGTLDICLAVDYSLSMLADAKHIYAQSAAREFLRQLGSRDRAALVGFADRSTLLQELTRDRTYLDQAVLSASPTGSSTAFLDGVYWAITQVALRPQPGSVVGAAAARPEARRVVLALTDGVDNASTVSTRQVVEYARANGVSLCMVALGQDAQTGLLELMARETGGIYLRAPSAADLQRLYVSLAEQLRQEYRITIRSPYPAADGTRRDVRVALAAMPVHGDGWYQAPGQGSMLVTVAESGSPSGAATAAAPEDRGPGGPLSQLALGLLLAMGGLGAAAAGFFYWLGRRPGRLAIRDSNPRIDLLPLWVRDGSTRVGRGAECELVLDSHQVSRVHARIEAANGIFLLFDEGSRNGTYVNGRRVRRSRELHVGDVIRFGDREFRFAGELAVG